MSRAKLRSSATWVTIAAVAPAALPRLADSSAAPRSNIGPRTAQRVATRDNALYGRERGSARDSTASRNSWPCARASQSTESAKMACTPAPAPQRPSAGGAPNRPAHTNASRLCSTKRAQQMISHCCVGTAQPTAHVKIHADTVYAGDRTARIKEMFGSSGSVQPRNARTG